LITRVRAKGKATQLAVLFFFITSTACFSALALRCGLGVGPWDAMAKTIAEMTRIQVGSVGLIMNLGCVAIQLILQKGKIHSKVILQIPLCILLGIYINFFFYRIFPNVSHLAYINRLMLLLFSYICLAFSIAIIMELNIVTFSLEGTCRVLQAIVKLDYGVIRLLVDLLCIVLCLVIYFTRSEILNIREGSVIVMLLFGPLLSLFSKRLRN
jgi:uncharacterized membrane protein YczE